jgi:outer membrane protein TolC
MKTIPQASAAVKLKLLCITGCGLLALTLSAAETETKALSLQDCIQDALEKNLDLRIERYNPQMAYNSLRAVYAGYEPVFNASGGHQFSAGGAAVDQFGFIQQPNENEGNNINSSVSGVLPTGLTYSLGTSGLFDQHGTRRDWSTNSMSWIPSEYSTSGGSVGLNLSQPLLKNAWIDGTRLAISAAKNQVKYSEQNLRLVAINTITSVELAYYDLIFARENVLVQEKALELSQRLAEENKKRVEVGSMAPLDQQQAEAEVARTQSDLIAAQRTMAVAQNILKTLIGDNFGDWEKVTLQPTETLAADLKIFDLQTSWSKGLTMRPDMLMMKISLEQQGIQLKYDRNQMWPSLNLNGYYGFNGAGNSFGDTLEQINQGSRPEWSVGASFSIPLGNGAARNTLKNSKAQMEKMLLSLKKLEQTIMSGIDNAILQARASYQRVKASRKACEYAAAALAAEQKKLENGKSTSFVVLRLQRDLTSARSDEISAQTEYLRAIANLAAAEGSTLERHAVDVNAK